MMFEWSVALNFYIHFLLCVTILPCVHVLFIYLLVFFHPVVTATDFFVPFWAPDYHMLTAFILHVIYENFWLFLLYQILST